MKTVRPPDRTEIPALGQGTWGHSGIAVQEGDGKWLLYAEDAYFFRGEIGGDHYECPPGLRG